MSNMTDRNNSVSVGTVLSSIEKILGIIGKLVLAVMGIVVSLQILFRVAPINYQGVWTTEIARALLVIMTLTGVPYAMRRGNHISIRPLLRMLSGTTRRVLLVFSNALAVVMCSIVVVSGYSVLDQTLVQSLPTVEWVKIGYLTYYLIGAFALCLVFVVEKMIRNAREGTVEVGHRRAADD